MVDAVVDGQAWPREGHVQEGRQRAAPPPCAQALATRSPAKGQDRPSCRGRGGPPRRSSVGRPLNRRVVQALTPVPCAATPPRPDFQERRPG
ncbi:hypothetical protein QJS66_00905 [Kocuria rhizophila]|nr:hypothetical protein QJS66_00905 [Kocuria rhizophila]